MLYINIILLLIVFLLISILLSFYILDYLKPLKVFRVTLLSCSFVFLGLFFILLTYDPRLYSLQYIFNYNVLPILNITFSLGIDSLSIFFLCLTGLLIPFCLISSWANLKKEPKFFFLLFSLLNFFLILVFCSGDVLLFYIAFEGVLIPMFFIVGIWGSRERKVRASYLFFFYTLFGSIFMLLGIVYMYTVAGSTSLDVLTAYNFSEREQRWLWLSFFLSLASKVPLFPFHIWLPEAHVEAPTGGSVLLAGVLLKLGTYGFLRYSLTLFPEGCYFFCPLIFCLSIMGVIFGSLSAIRQTDFKRIIAYSSVAHMNLVVLGIFSFGAIGVQGAVLQSLSHGFVASGLFLLIGVIYDRLHTREISYFSGLTHIMPLFSTLFLLFTMANIALPGSSSFVGEFLMLLGLFLFNSTASFWGATSMVLGGAYSLWLYNRLCYGNFKISLLREPILDLKLREFALLTPLAFAFIFLGFYPDSILGDLTLYSYNGIWDYIQHLGPIYKN